MSKLDKIRVESHTMLHKCFHAIPLIYANGNSPITIISLVASLKLSSLTFAFHILQYSSMTC